MATVTEKLAELRDEQAAADEPSNAAFLQALINTLTEDTNAEDVDVEDVEEELYEREEARSFC